MEQFTKESNYQRRNRLEEKHLLGQIIYLDCMHRELWGISHLLHVADGINLVFRYQRHCTARKIRQPARVAVLLLGLIRDLTKVCHVDDWLFED